MTEIGVELPAKLEFAAVEGSYFSATLPDGSALEFLFLKLEEVVSNSVQETFTLQFRAPITAPIAQGIYHLKHEKLGSVDLFLVPIKKAEDGVYFEAVFNHFLAAP